MKYMAAFAIGEYWIEPYFSRSYPINPEDGQTFEEAKKSIIAELQSQIDWWEKQTEEGYFDG